MRARQMLSHSEHVDSVRCRRQAARRALAVLIAFSTGSAAACASAGGSTVTVPAPAAGGALHVLTAEEMRRDAVSGVSLYEVVRELRPGFMRSRGVEPAVLINGRYAGPLAVLREIPVRSVREVRLVRGVEVPLVYGPRLRGATVLDVALRR
jgi:hypothetical protein